MSKLEDEIKKLNKAYKDGTVFNFDNDDPVKIDVIPTGSLSLDIALGTGGFPRGRVVEILGPESSGKTTLALHAIANAQKKGGNALFVDAEHALDINYARNLGVITKRLHINQPSNGEEGLEVLDSLMQTGEIDIAVVDSVASLTPKAEIDGEMGDSKMGLHARLMSQALRKLTATVAQTKTCCIFINQYRQKIGITFGDPRVGTGGNALKFYASVRAEISRIGKYEAADKSLIGNKTRVKVMKNKLAAPFKEAEFNIIYGKGIDYIGDVLDVATNMGIILLKGSWYAYDDTKIGQGREKALGVMNDNPEMVEEIIQKIIQ